MTVSPITEVQVQANASTHDSMCYERMREADVQLKTEPGRGSRWAIGGYRTRPFRELPRDSRAEPKTAIDRRPAKPKKQGFA